MFGGMRLGRTARGMKNAVICAGAQCVQILLSFLTRTVFVAALPAEYLGIGGLFSNILTVLSLAELGMGDAFAFALYRPMKAGDREGVRRLYRFGGRIYRGLALAVAVLGLGVSLFLEWFVEEVPAIPENFRVVYLLFLADAVCSYGMGHKRAVLAADQNSYVTALVTQLGKAGQLCAQAVCLYVWRSYYGYLLIQIAGTVSVNLWLSRIVRSCYPDLDGGSGMPDASVRAQMQDHVRSLAVSKVAGVAANGTDNIILSRMLGLGQVGLLSNYTMVTNAVSGVLWQGVNALMGSIGNFNVDAPVERKRQVFDQLFLLSYWLYGVVCVCLAVLLDPFVTDWLGEGYTIGPSAVFALSLTVLVTGINFPAYSFRVTHGLFRQIQYFHMASAVGNLLLSVALATRWGMYGVLIATSIARIATSEMADGYLVYRNILQRPFLRFLGRYFGGLALYGINLTICGAIAGRVPGFLGKAVVCFGASNLVMLAAFGRSEAFWALVKRWKGEWRK